MGKHFQQLGTNLRKATAAYNSAVGSLESRVLVSARKFKELGAAGKDEIKGLPSVDATPRQLQATEMLKSAEPNEAQDGA